jgi:hypothetical protein
MGAIIMALDANSLAAFFIIVVAPDAGFRTAHLPVDPESGGMV